MNKQDSYPPLAPNAWLRYDTVDRFVRERRPSSILEMGAGGGAVGARLSAHARYSAVEPDETSRAIAVARLSPPSVVVADLAELGDVDFELLCAFEVLEHVENDRATLRSWMRFVRPSGYVLVSVPAHQKRFSYADTAAGHLRRYDPADLRELLADVGLFDIRVETYGFPVGHALEGIRNGLARRARSSEAKASERTAASARMHQPSDKHAVLTRLATAPFRRTQRLFRNAGLGVGLVGWGQKPPSTG